MQSGEYCVITSIESFPAIKIVDEAANAIEELQAAVEREKAFADCWEEMAQECKARFEKLLSAYREKHADNCPHYIRNVHDRGDDSLCDVLMTEPPKLTYKELLHAAKKMHTWIFLNTGDEQKAYDECGLSDEMNAALGYGGQFEIKVNDDV